MAGVDIDDRQPAMARAPPGRRRVSPWPSGTAMRDDVRGNAFEPGLFGGARGIVEFDDAGNSAHVVKSICHEKHEDTKRERDLGFRAFVISCYSGVCDIELSIPLSTARRRHGFARGSKSRSGGARP